MTEAVRTFARDGFVGPIPMLTQAECAVILTHLRRSAAPKPPLWEKGRAVTDWFLSALAASPRLLAHLTPLLGDDLILWGASLVQRSPGQAHRWHVDIESSSPDGGFVSVWIGLENTSKMSGLRLIAGSHLCGKTVQQFEAETASSWKDSSTERVLAWARSANPEADVADPEIGDGQAILFDGRTWHGSHSQLTEQTRSALLLQFAAADRPVRMPDRRVASWPFQFLDEKPPVILVSGRARTNANRLVPAPKRFAPAARRALRSTIRKLDLPPEDADAGGWKPYPLFRGSTPALGSMSCHAAVLSAGHSPHAPHCHPDEELLVVLDGEAELLIADKPDYAAAQAVPVKAGDFAYYPGGQHHTIRNPAASPVTYLMFRWNRPGAELIEDMLPTRVFRATPPGEAVEGRGFVARRVFSGPTRWLRKLHCHVTRLEPGAGYAPHVDPYDVAILVQSGRLWTLGREVGPGSLGYYAAGDMHGMRNVGDEPAHYLVFEFHGRPLAADAQGSTEFAEPRLATA